MKWVCLFVVILLTVSKFYCNDTEKEEEEEEEKEVKKIMEPDESDKSASDAIINYNELVSDAEDKIEHQEDSKFKNLLHEDAPELKLLSEGDMMLDYKDKEMENGSINPNERRKRGMTAYSRKLWFTKVVPYVIEHPGTIKKSAGKVRKEILQSMETIEKASCLTFRAKQIHDRNWLRFFKGSGCYSGIGKKYWGVRATDVSLGDYCVVQPIILHEILHALGFFHEQTRPDRDSYVNVYTSNINPNLLSNFKRHPSYAQDTQNSLYDYQGLMHYGNRAFSINGKDTLSAKFDANRPLGGPVLTPLDIKELKIMYKCDIPKGDAWSQWSNWTVCYRDSLKGCVKSRQRVCFAHPDDAKCKGGDKFGVKEEFENCKAEECKEMKLRPHWGAWTEFSQCSRHCGDGYFTRSRLCNNPPPSPGSDEQCDGLPTQTRLCKIKRCYPKYYPYDGDFENGFQPWRHDDTSELNWEITDSQTPSEVSGPTKPFLSKHYAYLTATSVSQNRKKGRIISPILNDFSEPVCVTFDYQMNGKSINYLEFYVRTISGVYKKVWSKRKHQGNFWRKGAFTIPEQTEKYEIIVEGKTKLAPYSDIAVDDIRINRGKCFQGTEGCNDYNVLCKLWMHRGECHINYKWMLKGCCKSCAEMSICENDYDKDRDEKKCTGWAEGGECTKNRKWMWKNCCSACKVCVDYSHGCRYWAKKGWCEKSQWMKDNCKTSCNICKV